MTTETEPNLRQPSAVINELFASRRYRPMSAEQASRLDRETGADYLRLVILLRDDLVKETASLMRSANTIRERVDDGTLADEAEQKERMQHEGREPPADAIRIARTQAISRSLKTADGMDATATLKAQNAYALDCLLKSRGINFSPSVIRKQVAAFRERVIDAANELLDEIE